MKKLLLATVLAATVAVPALAQTDSSESMFRSEADPTDLHASSFIGMRVYRSDTTEQDAYEGVQEGWDDIGEINDVILSREGSVEAVLVDIGGFLGIGENQVAVDMGSLRFVSDNATPDDSSDYLLVMNAPRGALEDAPSYGAGDDMEADSSDPVDAMEKILGTADAGDIAETKSEETASAAQTREAHSAGSGTETMASDNASATPATQGDATAHGGMMADRSAIMRDGYMAAEEVDLTAERLTGAPVFDSNDERIGEVSELLLSADGQVRAAVVDVGGFLGIGEKPVELGLEQIDIVKAKESMRIRVYVPMTEHEMEAMPHYGG